MKNFNILLCFLFSINIATAQSTDCNTATILNLSSGTACVNGTNSDADTIATSYSCTGPGNYNEVWYTFVTQGNNNVITLTAQSISSAYVILTTEGCDGLYLLCEAASGDTLTVPTAIEQGTQVWIKVGSSVSTAGTFDLCVESNQDVYAGNNCYSAQPYCGDDSLGNAISFPATDNYLPSAKSNACFEAYPTQDLWLKFTIEQAGTVEFELYPYADTDLDFAIYRVYDETCPEVELDCNWHKPSAGSYTTGMINGFGSTNGYEEGFSAAAGEVYMLQIDNYSKDGMGFDMDWIGTAVLSCDTATTTASDTSTTTCSVAANMHQTGPVYLCGEDTTSISVNGAPSYSYKWFRNNFHLSETDSIIKVTEEGAYRVHVTDTNGCVAYSLPVQVVSNALSVTTASTDPNCSGFCDGTAAVLTSNGMEPFNYSWSDGSMTSDISGVCPGTYHVTVTDSTGCHAADTVTISTVQMSVPGVSGDTSVTPGNCVSLEANGLLIYSWLSDSTLNDTSIATPTACPVENTQYCITGTDSSDCPADTSCMVVQVQSSTSIDDQNDYPEIKGYPNPVANQLTIELKNVKGNATVIMQDIYGRVCYSQAIKNSTSHRISTVGISPGIYFLKVDTKQFSYAEKFIIKE